MESESILRYLENKTILVTGAAGFLAKIFVEKILRVQPNVKKIYLLLRSSDSNSAKRRLDSEVVGTDLFKVLRQKLGKNFDSFMSDKLVVVPGDITYENMGVKDSYLREEMWKDIDIIVNSAATTDFYERYDISLAINTMGVLHVLKFAKRCAKLKLLLHISTAYVCGEGKGLILEKEFQMGETLKPSHSILDFRVEMKLVAEKLKTLEAQGVSDSAISTIMREFGIERARQFGWPNTYVFTKAMGEMCLGQYRDNLPTVVIRPTMVTSTYKEPFPGWIEGLRTIDSVIVGYGKGKITCFFAGPNLTLDMIPADMVINAMVVAIVAHANDQSSNMVIYHVGSSLRNPINFAWVHRLSYNYFIENPLANKQGKPVKVVKGTVFTNMATFRLYMVMRVLLPLKLLQLLNTVFCGYFRDLYTNSNRKFTLVMRLVELYKPYLLFNGIFDDINSERLRHKARASCNMEVDLFNFDPKCIDWEEYIMNSHIPGLKKYVIK